MEEKDQKKVFEKSKEYLENYSGIDLPVEEQIYELSKLIKYHEWKYYIKNDPLISDYEYDQLFKLLEKLEKEYIPAGEETETVSPTVRPSPSPTARPSPDIIPGFAKVKHYESMLSLANSYNADDLKEFDKQIKKLLDKETKEQITYSVEPKFDGGSIALLYENDRFIRAATRGNGEIGDEITANIEMLDTVPEQAAFSKKGLYLVELRGEAIIRKDVFQKINKKREETNLTIFANPRNAATGGLRMKNPTETAERGIEVFIYQISYASQGGQENEINRYFQSHHESVSYLDSLGFKVPQKERTTCQGIEKVIEFCTYWAEKRDDYPYEIDGMVVKVDHTVDQQQIGSTSHHPRWAIAYKFKAKQATSKIRRVEFQVGKIGSITPVAKIDPVPLAGVTVSSISLHNEDFIKEKDLRLGDNVLVERAGDVIPYIVKAITETRDGSETPIVFPKICPFDDTGQSILYRAEGESAWRCVNCTCGQQNLQRLIFFVSKSAMDIDGFGKSLVERFYQLGWIQDFPDIYKLDFEKIRQLDGFGEKSASNLKRAIEYSKQASISRLLQGLCIHHLGQRASQLIAKEISSIRDLFNWEEDQYVSIYEIGPVLAKNMVQYFHEPNNQKMIEELEAVGVNLSQTKEDQGEQETSDGKFAGKNFLFTGSLSMKRADAEKIAEQHGAKIISGVSSKLDYLVVGEKPGSKLQKAQKLESVTILTEQEFLEMVES